MNKDQRIKLKSFQGSMNTIQGIPRHQMQFTSLDDFIGTENSVRIIDAFVEKLHLVKLGIGSTIQPIPERITSPAGNCLTKLKLMQVVPPIAGTTNRMRN